MGSTQFALNLLLIFNQIILEPILLYETFKDTENKEKIQWWAQLEKCAKTKSMNNCMDYCEWRGIYCENDLTAITSIYFGLFGLKGFIHWEYLPKKLRVLDLSNSKIQNLNFNDLSQSMLEILYLNNNGIQQIDLSGLSKTNLKGLDLSNNELNNINFIEIWGSVLEDLNLDSNKIVNVTFNDLVGSRLKRLHLSSNPIMSVDFMGIERISSLNTLYIQKSSTQNVYNLDHLKKSKLYQLFKEHQGMWCFLPESSSAV